MLLKQELYQLHVFHKVLFRFVKISSAASEVRGCMLAVQSCVPSGGGKGRLDGINTFANEYLIQPIPFLISEHIFLTT